MAITLTPKQQKLLIKELNQSYTKDKKGTGREVARDKLPPEMQNPPIEKLLEKEAGNAEFLKRVQDLRAALPDRADQILRGFIKFGEYPNTHGEDKVAPDAFWSVETPPEILEPVTAYDWQIDGFDRKGKESWDSESVLRKMSAEEREWFLKKLTFPHVYKKPDKGEIGLYGKVPVKKKIFNARFDMEKFMDQAGKLIERPKQKGLGNTEKLIEDLAELLSEKAQGEEQYREDEDNILESEGDYTAEDARGRSWQDLTQNLDDNVMRYVKILEEKDVDRDDIKSMLIESADNEYNGSYHNTDNAIGSQGVSSEHEVYLDNQDEWVEDPKWPYPGDFDANLALLGKEDIERLQDDIDPGSAQFTFNKEKDQWELSSLTVYTSDSASIALVVDPKQFILNASRYLKDMKIKRKHNLGAALERFPALSRVLEES